jgi:hypothetical protein
VDAEFVSIDIENSFSIGPVPIRERTAFNMARNGLVLLAYRVGAEVGQAPVHDGHGFFCSSRLRLFDANLGRSERVMITEKRP